MVLSKYNITMSGNIEQTKLIIESLVVEHNMEYDEQDSLHRTEDIAAAW